MQENSQKNAGTYFPALINYFPVLFMSISLLLLGFTQNVFNYFIFQITENAGKY